MINASADEGFAAAHSSSLLASYQRLVLVLSVFAAFLTMGVVALLVWNWPAQLYTARQSEYWLWRQDLQEYVHYFALVCAVCYGAWLGLSRSSSLRTGLPLTVMLMLAPVILLSLSFVAEAVVFKASLLHERPKTVLQAYTSLDRPAVDPGTVVNRFREFLSERVPFIELKAIPDSAPSGYVMRQVALLLFVLLVMLRLNPGTRSLTRVFRAAVPVALAVLTVYILAARVAAGKHFVPDEALGIAAGVSVFWAVAGAAGVLGLMTVTQEGLRDLGAAFTLTLAVLFPFCQEYLPMMIYGLVGVTVLTVGMMLRKPSVEESWG